MRKKTKRSVERLSFRLRGRIGIIVVISVCIGGVQETTGDLVTADGRVERLEIGRLSVDQIVDPKGGRRTELMQKWC